MFTAYWNKCKFIFVYYRNKVESVCNVFAHVFLQCLTLYWRTVSVLSAVLLQDINMRKPFKSSIIKEQQVICKSTRPQSVMLMYQHCCEPAPALHILNPFRFVARNDRNGHSWNKAIVDIRLCHRAGLPIVRQFWYTLYITLICCVMNHFELMLYFCCLEGCRQLWHHPQNL